MAKKLCRGVFQNFLYRRFIGRLAIGAYSLNVFLVDFHARQLTGGFQIRNDAFDVLTRRRSNDIKCEIVDDRAVVKRVDGRVDGDHRTIARMKIIFIRAFLFDIFRLAVPQSLQQFQQACALLRYLPDEPESFQRFLF